MNDKKKVHSIYSVRWTQPYSPKLTKIDFELIAQKMMAEAMDNLQLEESGYKEANQVINHIKSL